MREKRSSREDRRRGRAPARKRTKGAGGEVGQGSGGDEAEEMLPVVFMLLSNHNYGLGKINVMAIDLNPNDPPPTENVEETPPPLSPRVSVVTSLEHEDEVLGMGFTVHNSKIYIMGGGLIPRQGIYTRKVYVGSLCRDLANGGAITCKWELGPALHGGKPSPMVVTVSGKIYALAGKSVHRGREFACPPFEVLDTKSNYLAWRSLAYPPFAWLYSKRGGPTILGFTVVGPMIYVLLDSGHPPDAPPGCLDSSILYSFNTSTEEWTAHPYYGPPGGASKDYVAERLKDYEWCGPVDVVNNLFYRPMNVKFLWCTRTFAVDLTPAINSGTGTTADKVMRRRCHCCEEDDDLCSFLDDPHLLPIHGLTHITELIPREIYSSGHIVHLRDNLFCLFGFCHPNAGLEKYVHVTVFTVQADESMTASPKEGYFSFESPPTSVDGCLHARVISTKMHPVPIPDIAHLLKWCKSPL